MLNITQIPAPRVELIDPRTGLMSREWFRFFNNIYTIVGANLGVIQIPNGGTGLGTLPTDGQLLIGDTTTGAYVLNTIASALGISVTNGAGAITLSNTGVLSNASGLGISVSSATGDVTITNTGVLSNIAGTGISVSSATGDSTITNTGVLSVSGTAPVVSSGGATPAISMAAATTAVDGYLTSTDWNTFNNKLSAQVYPSAGIPNSTGTAWDTSYSTTGSGSVVALADSPTFTTAITSTGALQLTGSTTVNQNIATNQTTGTLTVGGATSTGAIKIGRSNQTHTLSLGSGLVIPGQTRQINIGTVALGTGVSNVSIGRYSNTVAHTTNINGKKISLTAETLTITNTGALTIGQNLLQSVVFVFDLTTLVGVATGSRAFVTDATSPVFGAIVVDGGGTGTPVPVYYDGTDWRVG